MAHIIDASSDTNDLGDKIIKCIESGIHLVMAIAIALQRSRPAVDNHLRRLEAEGIVHHIKSRKPGAGYINYWMLGPGEMRVDAIEVRTIVLTKAQAGQIKMSRDPLVAALFGAPKQSPHRCTACGVEQGEQHQRGCIVALVAA